MTIFEGTILRAHLPIVQLFHQKSYERCYEKPVCRGEEEGRGGAPRVQILRGRQKVCRNDLIMSLLNNY